MGGQQRTPPGRMVLLTISVALLSIFANPGSGQENQTFVYSSNQTAESHSENGSNHSAMASNNQTYIYSSNQTVESGLGHASNYSGMTSNHIGMSQPLELSEHGSNHSGMEQPLELIEDGEVPVEIPDDKCCSEKTVGESTTNSLAPGRPRCTTAWTTAFTTPVHSQGTFGSTASGPENSPSNAMTPKSPHPLGITIPLQTQ